MRKTNNTSSKIIIKNIKSVCTITWSWNFGMTLNNKKIHTTFASNMDSNLNMKKILYFYNRFFVVISPLVL